MLTTPIDHAHSRVRSWQWVRCPVHSCTASPSLQTASWDYLDHSPRKWTLKGVWSGGVVLSACMHEVVRTSFFFCFFSAILTLLSSLFFLMMSTSFTTLDLRVEAGPFPAPPTSCGSSATGCDLILAGHAPPPPPTTSGGTSEGFTASEPEDLLRGRPPAGGSLGSERDDVIFSSSMGGGGGGACWTGAGGTGKKRKNNKYY